MRTFDIHEAKTQLSRLVDQAAKGEPFVIAKAGKPLVKVVPLNAPEAGTVKRLGFMAGHIRCRTISIPWARNVCSIEWGNGMPTMTTKASAPDVESTG